MIRKPRHDEGAAFRPLFEDFFGKRELSGYADSDFGDILVDPDTVVLVNEDHLCRIKFGPLAAKRPPLPFEEGDMLSEVTHLLPEAAVPAIVIPLLYESLFQSLALHLASASMPVFATLKSGNDPDGVLLSTGVDKAQAWKQITGFAEIVVLGSATGSVGFAYAPHLAKLLDHLQPQRPTEVE